MANPYFQHPQFQDEALRQHPVAEDAFNCQDQPDFADAQPEDQDEPMSPLSRNLISLAMSSAHPALESSQIPSYPLTTSLPEHTDWRSALPIPNHFQGASPAPQGSIFSSPGHPQGASPFPHSQISALPFQNNLQGASPIPQLQAPESKRDDSLAPQNIIGRFKSEPSDWRDPLTNMRALIGQNIPEDLPHCITQWVFDNDLNGKIRRAHDLDGGWEVWAQVELAMHIKRKYKPSQLLREQKIYNDFGARKRKQVDLVMTSDDSTVVPELQVLELKCQTKDETLTTFATRVLADAHKVVDQPGLHKTFNHAKVTVFAISYGSKPVDVFSVLSEKFETMQGLYELRAFDENRNVAVWMWEPLGRETTKAVGAETSLGVVFPHPSVCMENNEYCGKALPASVVDGWNVFKAAMGGYDNYGHDAY